MSKKRFKLMQRPVRPERGEIHVQNVFYEPYNLQEILDNLGCTEPSRVDLWVDNVGYDDVVSIIATYKRPKTDKEFKATIEKYDVLLEEYNKWYSENHQEADTEIEYQRRKVIERSRHDLIRQRKNLRKNISDIDGLLTELEEKDVQ